MNVHDGLRTIFLHNPRTAGSSIEIALGLCHGHDTMEQAKVRHGSKWNEYFTWSIVRDPMTRLCSTFEFAQAEISWYHNNKEPGPDGAHGDRHPDFQTVQGLSLDDCCRLLLSDPSRLKHPGWLPQTHFISDPAQLDFVGRFENLADDWKHVCRKLGVDIPLPRINETARLRDRTEYYTPFVCEFVARLYRADYVAFGYKLPLPVLPDAAPDPAPPITIPPPGVWATMPSAPVDRPVMVRKGCCGG